MAQSQGARANTGGKVLESTIKSTLDALGFEIVAYSAWVKQPNKFGQELLLCNAPYQTIYKHNGKTEFLIRSARFDLEVRVECKWQRSSGSVDEKFPYTYLNCAVAVPEDEVIIVYDGGGAKAGAVTWLREAIAERLWLPEDSTKHIQLMNLVEFLVWVQTELL